jgi:glycosyltransferase involved in cell wall biosynthesis
MKKILFVITKSNWGGAQRYVFDLATHLPKSEFHVVAAFGQRGRLAEELAKAGVVAHNLSTQRDVSAAADWRTLLELYRLFTHERPDIVHLNSSKMITLGALAARAARVPRIISTVHGWAFNEARPGWQKALIKTLHWCGVLLSHQTIVVSNFDLAQARHWPLTQGKLSCIHNGIDLHMAFGSGDVIRSAFPRGAHITGTVGELTKNKNQIALVEQAKKDPALYVAIVGEGELRPMLEQKIQEYSLVDRVRLFGFMPASDVLKGFDTFALPSQKEGLPYVLLEAKAAGLPITATPVGGISEILNGKLEDFSLERMVEETERLYRA